MVLPVRDLETKHMRHNNDIIMICTQMCALTMTNMTRVQLHLMLASAMLCTAQLDFECSGIYISKRKLLGKKSASAKYTF